jgi:predicted nuclease with RNAse H fold
MRDVIRDSSRSICVRRSRCCASPARRRDESFVDGQLEHARVECLGDGVKERAIKERLADLHAVGTDRRPALVVIDAPVELPPRAAMRPRERHEGAAAGPALREATEQIRRSAQWKGSPR